ncbi:MAG: glycosyltransferase family 2 protein, partial [Synergistaceae bacterium]|nr:glycosyltransferase family 2 protein [Synergistaceae bacterium]
MKVVSLQVSVVVLIYNGSWERIRATLNSIIMQKDIKFELIIMDDCSDAAHLDEIKEFLANHSV